MVMLALRCAPLEDNGVSPAQMVYGSVLSLPSPFLDTRQPPSDDFLHQLRMASAALPVVATNSAATPRTAWLDDALSTCSHSLCIVTTMSRLHSPVAVAARLMPRRLLPFRRCLRLRRS